MKINIVNKSDNPLPKYETPGSAGIDLASNVEDVVKVGDRRLIKTGLFMEIPFGYEGQVRPRSGLALKKGIEVVNSPGTIDCDYRGEIGVIIKNGGHEDFWIHKGDKIAQLVITPVEQAIFNEVKKLVETERGEGGFGSTDTHSFSFKVPITANFNIEDLMDVIIGDENPMGIEMYRGEWEALVEAMRNTNCYLSDIVGYTYIPGKKIPFAMEGEEKSEILDTDIETYLVEVEYKKK